MENYADGVAPTYLTNVEKYIKTGGQCDITRQ